MRAIPIAGAAVTAAIINVALAGWYFTSGSGKSSSLTEEPAIPSSSQTTVVRPDLAAPETTGTIAKPLLARVEPASPPPVPRAAAPKCPPATLGVSRRVEIDTTAGPGFGFQHFKTYDFLEPGEVVLTFDDGPWPNNTPAVLAALAAQCVKATFFIIGKHAIWHPRILKQIAAQGHTIGTHTWSHVDLTKKTVAERTDEIEKGVSIVNLLIGGGAAPFFRFPTLRHPPETVEYLGQRNIASFSTDIDSLDFKIKNPDAIVAGLLANLKKRGKGILLMHDFQHATAVALPQLLEQLRINGYRVVHLQPKEPVRALADYDALVARELKGSGSVADARPAANAVRTITRRAD
ncbi:MAG: polysaccharide deacetylase family protein [Rhodoplanes sp.]